MNIIKRKISRTTGIVVGESNVVLFTREAYQLSEGNCREWFITNVDILDPFKSFLDAGFERHTIRVIIDLNTYNVIWSDDDTEIGKSHKEKEIKYWISRAKKLDHPSDILKSD